MKTLKTIKETPKGKNLKSIDLKTLKITTNKELIKKTKEWKLPGYMVVSPKKKENFIKSNPDKQKWNNLDPKLKVLPKKKLDKNK